jgi:UDP-glucose 4-epimerase
MKVLITGAGGNLGRVVAPALVEQGHTPRLMDFRPLQTPYEFVQADVRDLDQLRRAVAGVDAIVHAAALHGIHLRQWQPRDFWAINVTGTFNLFEAAREAGIQRIILCSTMGVYGQSATPSDDAWGVVTEESPLLPTDVYGMSKRLCEEMAHYYTRSSGITTVPLRLGMFVPETFERYGFRLLFGGVDDRDVAQAVVRALTYKPDDGFDAFNIMAEAPFTAADARVLHADLARTLERHYPGVLALVQERELNLPELVWGRTIWSVDKAKRKLGYRPQYDFDGFLRALQAGETDYYPYAGLPWWGVEPTIAS